MEQTRCQSMIEAFSSGGDFHSRTAMNMYDHIKKEIDEGSILLEWDSKDGAAPKPLLKDVGDEAGVVPSPSLSLMVR